MDYDVTRREFLEVTAAAALVAFSEPRSRIELVPEERATLLAVVRTLFPYDGADERAYARVSVALEERCRVDAAAFTEVTRGIAVLDRQSSGGFAVASHREQVELLTRAKDSHFFRVVYAEGLEALCGAPDAWRFLT